MPTNTPEHVASALAEMALFRPAYDLAERYFLGRIDEVFSSQKLRQLIGPTGYRYRVNFARTPVDVLLERTTINALTCPDAGALALLNQVWDDNDLGLEAKDVHRIAYEFGDSYIVAWPDDSLPGGVEAYAHDPRQVRLFYDQARPRVKSHAVHVWRERGTGDQGNGLGRGLWDRIAIYYPDWIEQWVSRYPIDNLPQALTDREFVPYLSEGDAEPGVVENPTLGIIPVFHFRNGRPYGRPEHEDAYGPQDMINKLNITMMSSVDYAGFPQRYVLTNDALSPSVQDGFGPPVDTTFSTEHGLGLDDNSDMKAGPGETWILSGANLTVGQFATATTDNFLRGTESLIKQMASVTDLPISYFDRSGQQPSGESFRRSEASLNAKLSDRIAMFGVTWHEFLDYCLLVNSRAAPDAQVAWAPVASNDDKDSWEVVKAKQDAGVPVDQTLVEAGYAVNEVAAWSAEAPAATPEPSTPAVQGGQVPVAAIPSV